MSDAEQGSAAGWGAEGRGASVRAHTLAPREWSEHVELMPLQTQVLVLRLGPGARAVEVQPPGSKSLTNRALLLAALADGDSLLRRALTDADDAQVMIKALTALGASIRMGTQGDVYVTGTGGKLRTGGLRGPLDVRGAGTAMRFLAGAGMVADGEFSLDGSARMRQRPIGELGDALLKLGCRITYLGEHGFPPLRLTPPASPPTGLVTMPTTQSSQFISALLLMGPFLPTGITLRLTGPATSVSYVRMTLGLLAKLGMTVQETDDLRVVRVLAPLRRDGRSGMAGFTYWVEPDATGATYFWAAAALTQGLTVMVPGLGPESLQHDARFHSLMARMGAPSRVDRSGAGGISVRGTGGLEPIVADLSDMPDAAMTLASVACFARGTSVLRGLRTLRVKETDRIAAMRSELGKIGVLVEEGVDGEEDAVSIIPPAGGVDTSASAPRVVFKTYDDHRMAMSLALIGLRRPNVVIDDPRCVSKTYPTFWNDLATLYAQA